MHAHRNENCGIPDPFLEVPLVKGKENDKGLTSTKNFIDSHLGVAVEGSRLGGYGELFPEPIGLDLLRIFGKITLHFE